MADDVGRRLRIDVSKPTGNDVAVGVVESFLLGNLALINQLLNVRVVLGQRFKSLLRIEQITPAVAAPGDVGLLVDYPADDNSCTHAYGVRVLPRLAVNGFVSFLGAFL